MDKKNAVETLIAELMISAAENYEQQVPSAGIGFVFSTKMFEGVERMSYGLVPSVRPITNLPQLRRFAAAMRKVVRTNEGFAAGVMCEIPVSMDETAAAPTVVIFVDQKFGGMRVYMAPKVGEHLVFRDLGIARPGANFFPNLIPIELYGPVAEA